MASPLAAPLSGLEAITRNLCQAMCAYSRATMRGTVDTTPDGAVFVDSGVDYAVFNAAVIGRALTGGVDALRAVLFQAADHFGGRRRPWSFWLSEDLLEADVQRQAREVMAYHGLRLAIEHIGMLAETLAVQEHPLPALAVRRVSDAETRRDFCRITSRAFSLPDSIARKVYGSEYFWSGSYTAWIGYDGKKPVSTAATETAAGSIGLYSVATIPEVQGRGFGEAISRYSLGEAHRETGLARTILQSTRAGLPLYQKMGYRRLTRVAVYVSE